MRRAVRRVGHVGTGWRGVHRWGGVGWRGGGRLWLGQRPHGGCCVQHKRQKKRTAPSGPMPPPPEASRVEWGGRGGQHQREHRPQRPTESSDPTQHAKGRTGDCPGPRKETTTRRIVTQAGGGCYAGTPALYQVSWIAERGGGGARGVSWGYPYPPLPCHFPRPPRCCWGGGGLA